MTDQKEGQKNKNAFIESFAKFPSGLHELAEIQRKNMNVFAQAQQESLQNMQKIASKQGAIFSKIMQQTSGMANDLLNQEKPEEKLQNSARTLHTGYLQALENVKEVSDMVAEANAKTGKILQKRTAECLKETQDCSRKILNAGKAS